VNVGPEGAYLNTGIPGTGIYSRTRIDTEPAAKPETALTQTAQAGQNEPKNQKTSKEASKKMSIPKCASCGKQSVNKFGECITCGARQPGMEAAAYDAPSTPVQTKIYTQGNGEGALMFVSIVLTICSIIAGFALRLITVDIPTRYGFTEHVPVFSVPECAGYALGGLCAATIPYGLSKAIGLLKFIAEQADKANLIYSPGLAVSPKAGKKPPKVTVAPLDR
jgi:hypothetical protein